MKAQEGISLTEIMISLLLGSLLMTVILQHYLTSKRQYHQSQHLLESAFELEQVIQLISDSVRRAGFTPCVNSNALRFYDGRTNKNSPLAISIQGSKQDILHINRMAENFAQIIHFKNPYTIIVRGEINFKPGQIVLIADCAHAQALSVSGSKKAEKGTEIILTQPLKHSYQVPGYIGEWLEETFFIKSNSLAKPALFYHLHHTEELTNLVNSVVFSLKKNQAKTLVSMNLGLANGQNYLLEVAARTA